jgi:hypothetical protein
LATGLKPDVEEALCKPPEVPLAVDLLARFDLHDNTDALKDLPDLKETLDDFESMTYDSVKTLASYAYQTRWQLKQLLLAIVEHGLARGGGGGSKTSYGKEPTFVSLLTPALRNFNPDVRPVPLATHSRGETKEQMAIHKQRDDMFKEVEYLWRDEGKTWAKIPEDIRARMCEQMFQSPANWPWFVTMQRTTERISYVRGKGKNSAEFNANKAKNTSPAADDDVEDITTRTPVKVCPLVSVACCLLCLFSGRNVYKLCT